MRRTAAILALAPSICGAQLTDWKRFELKDRMGDSPTIAFYAESSERFTGASDKAGILIGCKGKKPTLVVNANVQLQPELGGRTSARIRLDDGAAVAVSGNESTSGDAVQIESPAQWVRNLAKAKRALVEVEPYRRGKSVAAFSVAGLAVHAAEIEKHCGIRLVTPK